MTEIRQIKYFWKCLLDRNYDLLPTLVLHGAKQHAFRKQNCKLALQNLQLLKLMSLMYLVPI